VCNEKDVEECLGNGCCGDRMRVHKTLGVDLGVFVPLPHIGIVMDVDNKQLVAVVSIWRPHCIRQRDAGGLPWPGVPFLKQVLFSTEFYGGFEVRFLRANKRQVVISPTITVTCEGFGYSSGMNVMIQGLKRTL
jgi:hypothetical protein